MGFNEAAGYGAVAVAAWATGAIAETAGLRPAPFLLGLAFAALGLARAAVGVYRLWRDIGFAVGAVLAGTLADLYALNTAIITVAVITAASGLDVTLRRAETHPPAARSAASEATSQT